MLKDKVNYKDGFNTQGLFEFNPQDHILDFWDLLREINTLDTSRLKVIAEYLENEILMSNGCISEN